MSLITRCPACETLFKVVPDQLRISEGWVRCGQCDEIFDASYHLLPESLTEAQPEDIPEAPPVDDPMPEAPQAEPPPLHVDLNPPQNGETVDLPEEWSQVVQQESLAPETLMSVSPQPAEALPLMPVVPLDGQSEMPETAELLEADSADTTGDAIRQAELADVSFLRNQKPDAPKPSPRKRIALFLLGFFLFLGLLVQVMVHERDRIMALAPNLQPMLQALCAPLACTLSPLRRLDSIVVESASFTKLNGTTYRLNFTVKNTATTALAVPAVELTLTDSFDQPVVRRVFLASEIGVKSPEIAAGAECTASLAVDVKVASAADPVAGYRVLAFYP